VTERADRWIRLTTIGCVGMLALIAGTVSYLHMHLLVELHGQPGWVAALTPLSVDGMIVAASTTLLAESRSGRGGGFLPWALLVIGSVASLAANVSVAEPTPTGRVIAAWPSFSLIAAYELLMHQIRRAAETSSTARDTRLAPGARSRQRRRRLCAALPILGACESPPRPLCALRLRQTCEGKLGAGLWIIELRMVRFPLDGRSPNSTADTRDGDGWSSVRACPVHSVPRK
jgi:Protein of unknown function (DUF2637)